MQGGRVETALDLFGGRERLLRRQRFGPLLEQLRLDLEEQLGLLLGARARVPTSLQGLASGRVGGRMGVGELAAREEGLYS